MTDVGATIAPRSDQLNSDDLISGPITIKITGVSPGNSEQPINIHYEGDGGKPYKPGKSMRRVMVNFWGRDGKSYVGRSLTLFRDPTIRFGGIAVGGIRISHMSDIGHDETMALTQTRGSKKEFTVKPLVSGQGDDGAADMAADLIRRAEALRGDAAGLAELAAKEGIIKRRAWLLDASPALSAKVDAAFVATTPADTLTPDNPTAQEGRSDEDHGDQHDGSDDAPAWRATVDAYLDSLTKLETLIDVKGAVNKFAADKIALPDDVIADIEAAENNALMRFSTAAAG